MRAYKQINQLLQKDLFFCPESQNQSKRFLIKFLKVVLCLMLISLGILYGRSTHFQPLPVAEKQLAYLVEQVLPFQPVQSEKINILILGRPGAGYPGENLTDTIIVVHLNPSEKAVLISLPRDLLVQIPGQAGFTRINQLYNLGGLEMVKQKIAAVTGLVIDNYILVDLVAVKQVIDLVDGLNIYVPQDIYDPQFPGPNYSYQTFTLKAGWRYLDGQTALKYIRTRHSGAGDFDRMWRQQQVLLALKQKVAGLSLFWDFAKYWKIFQTLREHIETNLSLSQMRELWQISQEISVHPAPNEIRCGTSQIIHLAIDGKSGLLSSGQIMLNGQPASILWPKAGRENYSEIQALIKATMD